MYAWAKERDSKTKKDETCIKIISFHKRWKLYLSIYLSIYHCLCNKSIQNLKIPTPSNYTVILLGRITYCCDLITSLSAQNFDLPLSYWQSKNKNRTFNKEKIVLSITLKKAFLNWKPYRQSLDCTRIFCWGVRPHQKGYPVSDTNYIWSSDKV